MENEWTAYLIIFVLFVMMITLTCAAKNQREKIRQIKGTREEYKSLIIVLKEILWK